MIQKCHVIRNLVIIYIFTDFVNAFYDTFAIFSSFRNIYFLIVPRADVRNDHKHRSTHATDFCVYNFECVKTFPLICGGMFGE